MNTNFSTQHNLSQIQRELDFQFANCVNIGNVTPTPNHVNPGMNKFNISNVNRSNNLSVQQLQPNSYKSLSFCGNLVKPRQITSPQNSMNPFSKDEVIDYKINLENIIVGRDKRTTLMIRNIPNKYTLSNIVDEFNLNFQGKFDYVNLPVDYERKLNLGYAFINFLDPMHLVLFYETYFNKKWNKYRSDKKIDLNYAEKQGKKDVSCRDENTYFAADDIRINSLKINPKVEFPMVIIILSVEILRLFEKNLP
jgi:hypothetical protein